MFKPNRLMAIGAVVGALAAAGPVASASAASAPTTAATSTSPGSSVPCYPFPAFCDPSTGKVAPWAPYWVRLALGQAPANPWPVLTFPQPPTLTLPTPVVPAG